MEEGLRKRSEEEAVASLLCRMAVPPVPDLSLASVTPTPPSRSMEGGVSDSVHAPNNSSVYGKKKIKCQPRVVK